MLLFVLPLFLFSCAPNLKEKQLQNFITAHVAKIEPLTTKANLTYWDASTTGKSVYYDKLGQLQLKIRQIYSNTQDYSLLKQIKESGQISDVRLARQLDKLYYAYLQNQIEPGLMRKIVDLDTQIQEEYNNFRGTIDG